MTTKRKSIQNNNNNNNTNEEEEDMQRKRTKEDEAGPPAALPSQIEALRLEAIFYPKFENENANDSEIRHTMCNKVGNNNNAVVEVTLKHSGSLLLWSGDERYYSKNSMDNKFTHVGEVLLRQHFMTCQHALQQQQQQQQQSDDNDKALLQTKKEYLYETCSKYIQQHRYTLCFEVVTNVLGDHGDVPHKDYLILTAVSCRRTQQFLSTLEVIQLAQTLYLPHNDTWMFTSPKSVQDLFAWYDANWETAHCSDTVQTLTKLSQQYLPSMYPHAKVQGEILEGIVIRFVEHHHPENNDDTRMMESLRSKSEQRSRLLSPNIPSACQLIQQQKQQNHFPPVLSTDLRDLFDKSYNNSSNGMNDKHAHFEQALRELLTGNQQQATQQQRSRFQKHSTVRQTTARQTTLSSLLEQSPSLTKNHNMETKRILQCIETLNSVGAKVDYPIFSSQQGGKVRWFCMIHVFHDETFKKYAKHMIQKNDNEKQNMKLFRGFCIELICNENDNNNHGKAEEEEEEEICKQMEGTNNNINIDKQQQQAHLMLKMKFLPYMVRTFGCRNGLSTILRDNNNQNYIQTYIPNLLSKWGVSSSAKLQWIPYFKAWSSYVLQHNNNNSVPNNNDAQHYFCNEKVTGAFYLEHLKQFTKQYNNQEFKDSPTTTTLPITQFRGLVIVVSLLRETSQQLADYIALHKLDHASRRYQNIKEVRTVQDLESCILFSAGVATATAGGAVCSAVVEDGTSSLRKLFKQQKNKQSKNANSDDDTALDYKDYITILLYKCTPKDIEDLCSEKKDRNRMNGMLQAWKKANCGQILHVGDDNSSDGNNKKQGAEHNDNLVKVDRNKKNHHEDKPATTKTTEKQTEKEEADKDNNNQHQNWVQSLETNSQFHHAMECVWNLSKSVPTSNIMDTRPGLLFFFPASLPGCGKSTYLGSNNPSIQDNIRQTLLSSLKAKQEEKEKEKATDNAQPPLRKIIFKEGDATKSKYWVGIKEERTSLPSSVYFADKNVPATTWSQVGQVCATTKAIAIPILPGYYCDNNNNETEPNTASLTPLLHTTILPNNDDNACFPFPLQYLAICMTRVLARKGKSHKGKLDSATPLACLIVLKFFSFYTGISADVFRKKLRNALISGCHTATSTMNNKLSSSLVTMGRPVVVPFLKLKSGNASDTNEGGTEKQEGNLTPLPKDLEELLIEALGVMYNWKLENIDIDSLHKTKASNAKQIAQDLEGRLRACIRKHKEFLLELTVAEELSRKEFLEQVTKQTTELDDIMITNDDVMSSNASFINIASIDVPVEDIHTHVVNEMLISNQTGQQQQQPDTEGEATSPSKSNLLSILFRGKEEEIINNGAAVANGSYVGVDEFVSNTHVTMAHYSQLSQECIHALFDDFLGRRVTVKVTGVLWTERIAALAVETPSVVTDTTNGDANTDAKKEKEISSPHNTFPHITLWHRADVKPVESNNLPQLVQEGKAKKVMLPKPITLHGTVSYHILGG